MARKGKRSEAARGQKRSHDGTFINEKVEQEEKEEKEEKEEGIQQGAEGEDEWEEIEVIFHDDEGDWAVSGEEITASWLSWNHSAETRGPYSGNSRTTQWRRRSEKEEEEKFLKEKGFGRITAFFKPHTQEKEKEKEVQSMGDLEEMMKKEKSELQKKRILAVLRFLEMVGKGRSKIEASLSISEVLFGAGPYKAICIRSWAKIFKETGTVPPSETGRHQKVIPFIEDEDLRKESLRFLRLQKAEERSALNFVKGLEEEIFPKVFGFSAKISERTARRWMEDLGFSFQKVGKGKYVDGHEREDVVEQRRRFVKEMEELEKRMATFEGEEIEVVVEPFLAPGEKKLILVVHDESTFQAHDAKDKVWMEEGKVLLRKKGEGRSLMVSDFLCECHGPLAIMDEDGKEEARVLWKVGKGYDGYWTNEDLVKSLKEKAIPIFEKLHPGCVAVFAFDNSQNHHATPPDGLLASKLNLSDGGKNTPKLKNTTFGGKPQAMQLPNGNQKGIKTILTERGLWQSSLRLDCKEGCKEEGGCCARRILQDQPDFQAQRIWLQGIVEEAGHQFLFFPKFHPEFNPIEQYWGAAKMKTRLECDFSFPSLQKRVPAALDEVGLTKIRRFFRRSFREIDSYRHGLTEEQRERAMKKLKSHRTIPASAFE